ncbi:hypothetical protein ACLMJK_004904 [Lecanora helva]
MHITLLNHHPCLHGRERRHYVQLSRLPVDARRGYPYPCTQDGIDDYQYSTSRRREYDFETLDVVRWFTKIATKAPDATQHEAFRRLRPVLLGDEIAPDIPIKAMRDIDNALFGGTLRGKVIVWWSVDRATFHSPGPGFRAAQTVYVDPGARVLLNAHSIYEDLRRPGNWIWPALIHELVVS